MVRPRLNTSSLKGLYFCYVLVLEENVSISLELGDAEEVKKSSISGDAYIIEHASTERSIVSLSAVSSEANSKLHTRMTFLVV